MRKSIIAGLLSLGLLAGPLAPQAQAIGCISGGVAGAAGGHMLHHGVVGAILGCIAGHELHKHEMAKRREQRAGYHYSRHYRYRHHYKHHSYWHHHHHHHHYHHHYHHHW